MKVLLSSLFYILTVNLANCVVHMLKHMVIGQSSNNLCTIIDPEAAAHQPQMSSQQDMDTVPLIVVNYSQVTPREAKKDKTVKSNWRNSI